MDTVLPNNWMQSKEKLLNGYCRLSRVELAHPLYKRKRKIAPVAVPVDAVGFTFCGARSDHVNHTDHPFASVGEIELDQTCAGGLCPDSVQLPFVLMPSFDQRAYQGAVIKNNLKRLSIAWG